MIYLAIHIIFKLYMIEITFLTNKFEQFWKDEFSYLECSFFWHLKGYSIVPFYLFGRVDKYPTLHQCSLIQVYVNSFTLFNCADWKNHFGLDLARINVFFSVIILRIYLVDLLQDNVHIR